MAGFVMDFFVDRVRIAALQTYVRSFGLPRHTTALKPKCDILHPVPASKTKHCSNTADIRSDAGPEILMDDVKKLLCFEKRKEAFRYTSAARALWPVFVSRFCTHHQGCRSVPEHAVP